MTAARRAVVTGAAGSVGANVVRALLRAGHEVTALVRPGSQSHWRLDSVRGEADVRELELLDGEEVRRLVHAVRPEWLFHLAAHGAYSWQEDTQLIMRTNLLSTIVLAEAARDCGCEVLVHTGSSSEYGFKDHAPGENELPEPNSDYAVAKAAATMYLSHAARRGQLHAVTLRLYTAYGRWEDPRRLIPRLVVHGMRGELPPLAQPDLARDYVAVDDAVSAMLMAAEAQLEPGEILNVGSGRQTSLAEIVEVARSALNIPVEPEWGAAEQRKWDTTTWVADISRIGDRLGWYPRIGLTEGFSSTADWLRASPELWPIYGVDR